jgi:outer membrane receptor protein involved in Fe transport
VGLVVDGVAMGTDTGQLIDVFGADRVTIERGPAGLFDGADAIGGAITVGLSHRHRTGAAERSGRRDGGSLPGRVASAARRLSQ